MIIIINGTAGSGKDTFVRLFTEVSSSKAVNLSTVDSVKTLAQCMGWDPGIKGDKERKLLSDLKDLWTQYNDGPFEGIKDRIMLGRCMHTLATALTAQRKQGMVFFIHCREPQEIDKIKQHYTGRCKTLLIRRSGTAQYHNHADMGVEDYAYDVVIENNSDMSALKSQAALMAQQIDMDAVWLREMDAEMMKSRSRE